MSDGDACEAVALGEGVVSEARGNVASCLSEREGSWRCFYQGPGGRLSVGACENGALNRDRWDCCTGDPFHDACVTGCGSYYR